jgi:cysteine synthase A
VECSSGNTGIGLAMVCNAKGYPFVCVMAESFSIERRKLMRFLGAKVVLTNPAHKGSGMVIKARELAEKHNWYWPNQFDNEANAWVHEMTTGPELLNAMDDETLDHLFLAYGTGGTLNGLSKVMKSRSPNTQIHVVEPDNAPMIYSQIKTEYPTGDGELPTFKDPHPVWRPHLLQGWAPDWIPSLVDKASSRIDNVCHVGGDVAMATSKALAQKEGIFTGTSGGGILASALKHAETVAPGTSIVAILPDTGERYLSTPLFDGIGADMTEEEKEIAASTPSSAPPPVPLPKSTDESVAFVKENIANNKVVIWSLQYCEFCWTITSFFDKIGVPYTQINIDSFEYAKDNMGNKYRAALTDLTDCATFPQCFIDGEFIGGAADACIKWRKNELQPVFEKAGIKYDTGYEGDPFEFLPKWMSQNPLRSK